MAEWKYLQVWKRETKSPIKTADRPKMLINIIGEDILIMLDDKSGKMDGYY